MAFSLDLNNKPSDYALSPEQMSPFGNLLQNALKNFSAGINAGYLPQEKQQNLQQQIAQTLIDQAKAKYAMPQEAANVNLTQQQGNQAGAQAGYLGSETRGQDITNQTLNQKNLADIAEIQARGNFYNQGGGRGGVNNQNLAQFNRQLRTDFPIKPEEGLNDYEKRINDTQSAYLSGTNALPDGTPLPDMSGTASQIFQNVTGKNAPAALKNQAAQFDVLSSNLNDFDINSLAKFAGPAGRIKLTAAKGLMAADPNDPRIDPDARNALTAINQSILTMDQLRKTYGTSVVPDYVYKTMGRLANPTDSIWNDPTQVKKNFNALVTEVNKNRDLIMAKVQRGVAAQPVNQGAAQGSSLKNLPEGKVEATKQIGNDSFAKINGKWYHQ